MNNLYKFIEKKIYDTFARHWMPGWGRHSLVVSEHPGFGSDLPIGLDRRRGATGCSPESAMAGPNAHKPCPSPNMASRRDSMVLVISANWSTVMY